MNAVAYLAPIAFVFALSALSQVTELKKRITYLEAELEKIKNNTHCQE